jgi:hypothetical protein
MLRSATKLARYAAIPLLAFVALSAWGFTSPVGSSPDETFHLSSIWCGQGLEAGECEAAGQVEHRKVPEALPNAAACYAFYSEVSANCLKPWFHQESDDLAVTDTGNFTGDYPPVFYATMNFFVGDDISRSVLAMRVANSALFVVVMTLLYWALPRGRRTMLVLGTVVALIPLGVFLIPSINPSSWALLSGAVVFPSLVGFFETSGRRRLALGGLAALGTLIGAGARADAAVYAAIATVAAVVVSARWREGGWKFVAYPLLLCIACALSYLSAGQSGAASVKADGPSVHEYDVVQQITYNVLNAPELWAGSFGSWGLGWLDTPMPSVVWVVNLVAFGAVLVLGIRRTSPRKTMAVILVLAAMWVLPTWILLQTEDLVGAGVQPRYLLPLLILLAQIALFRVVPGRTEISRSQLLFVAGGLTATNAIALHYNIRRYVTGTDVFAFNLDTDREWWWALPLSPMAVWLLGSVTFGVAIFLCARALLVRDDDVENSTPAQDSSTVPDEPTVPGFPPISGPWRSAETQRDLAASTVGLQVRAGSNSSCKTRP